VEHERRARARRGISELQNAAARIPFERDAHRVEAKAWPTNFLYV
jgi:hypothetical protein